MILMSRPHPLHGLHEAPVGVQEVGPAQDDGCVELAGGDGEHAVARHGAEGLVHAVALVLRDGQRGLEDVAAGDEAVAGEAAGHHLGVVRQGQGAAQLVVEKPESVGLKKGHNFEF